jgi:uncharacterized protein YbjQ (UPF0145 family)
LFCQIDAGYEPRHFVIGNVAYALGIARGISGGLKMFARRGEVKEFSDMYNHTRHLALERLEAEAVERGCNAVVDIITRIFRSGLVSANDHGRHRPDPALGGQRSHTRRGRLAGELWNQAQLGYAPTASCSAPAFAWACGQSDQLLSPVREISESWLVYDARETASTISALKPKLKADGVISIKIFIRDRLRQI